MSLFKVLPVASLAVVFVFAGCSEPEKTVEPGKRKERTVTVDKAKDTQSQELDISNIDP